MAYHASRNGQREYDNNENDPRQAAQDKKQQEREQEHKNTKSVAKDAGSLALQGLGVPAPLAGMAANKIANHPVVGKVINQASDQINKNPLAKQAINQIANSKSKNAAMSALGNKTGGTSGTNNGNKGLNTTGGKDNQANQNESSGLKGLRRKGSAGGGGSSSNGDASGSGESIGQIVSTIKKIPPFLWPVIGYAALFCLGCFFIISISGMFTPMYGSTDEDDLGMGGEDIEYEYEDEEEANFYERIGKIAKEYTDKGANYDSEYIAATFAIFNEYDPEFTYDDMTESEIRSLSKLMFKDSKIIITCEKEESEAQTVEGTQNSEPTCPDGYSENTDKRVEIYTFDEATFKSDLQGYIDDHLTLDGISSEEVADEVFEFIDSYSEFISDDNEDVTLSNNPEYWWPIGGRDTTESGGVLFATGTPTKTAMSSQFWSQESFRKVGHGAIDIPGTYYDPVDYVIAAKDGIVVYPTSNSQIQYPNEGCLSCSHSTDGGGYGNYVILKHSDGNYTLYAHMSTNSITVRAGDTVAQGQVLGIVGHTGRSTGAHLHFEVRVGQNTSSARQDPLTFVDPNNPRPTATSQTSQNLIDFIQSFEGIGPTPPDDTNYVVYRGPDGLLTVGYGVAIPYNLDRLSALGVDGNSLKEGDLVPRTIVDQVKYQVISTHYSNITAMLSREGITLSQTQIEALVSRAYNLGNVDSFPKNYKQYGDTQALYDNYMSKPITSNGTVLEGLKTRREAEWLLFHTGVYRNLGQ